MRSAPTIRLIPFLVWALLLLSIGGPKTSANAWLRRRRRAPESNTDQCIVNLGGLQSCDQNGFLGLLPENPGACCDGLRQFVKDGCFCNPAITVLLGGEEAKKGLKLLQPLCRAIQPLKWALVNDPSQGFIQNCGKYESKEYGCPQNDLEIDAQRLTAIFGFNALFDKASDPDTCVNVPAVIQAFSAFATEDSETFVPYGIGSYVGYQAAVEYVLLSFNALNKGYWVSDFVERLDKPAFFGKNEEGSEWVASAFTDGTFDNGNLPYTLSSSTKFIFKECDTRFSKFEVLPDEGIQSLVRRYVNTAARFDRYGIRDICEVHEKVCTGSLRQYSSYQDCVDSISALPLNDPQCGNNQPLAGNTKACKLKHHWLAITNPEGHCAHIGPLGAVDGNGNTKCNAAVECTEQQPWPAVDVTTDFQEAQFAAAVAASNQDLEANFPRPGDNLGATPNWPFGCAVGEDGVLRP